MRLAQTRYEWINHSQYTTHRNVQPNSTQLLGLAVVYAKDAFHHAGKMIGIIAVRGLLRFAQDRLLLFLGGILRLLRILPEFHVCHKALAQTTLRSKVEPVPYASGACTFSVNNYSLHPDSCMSTKIESYYFA